MVSYAEKRLHELIKRLSLATQQNLLEWKDTDREYAYMCALADTQVLVYTKDDDGVYPYILNVLDEDGKIVDTIKSGTDEWDNPDPWNDELMELYERARRSATSADAILDRILAQLPTLPPPPEEPPF